MKVFLYFFMKSMAKYLEPHIRLMVAEEYQYLQNQIDILTHELEEASKFW